jgi:hypothetical protein
MYREGRITKKLKMVLSMFLVIKNFTDLFTKPVDMAFVAHLAEFDTSMEIFMDMNPEFLFIHFQSTFVPQKSEDTLGISVAASLRLQLFARYNPLRGRFANILLGKEVS